MIETISNETKIICLIGASGSGKSTIAKELQKRGYNAILSYTTREPRFDNEWGHIFIEGLLEGDDIVSAYTTFPRKSMIAYFNSYDSDNHYFATNSQVMRGETNIYIVDSKGAEQVHEYYNHDVTTNVKTIYLQVDEDVRAKRMLDRVSDKSYAELHIDSPKEHSDVWARLGPDRKLFETVKCDYVINGNKSKEKVIRLMVDIIENL